MYSAAKFFSSCLFVDMWQELVIRKVPGAHWFLRTVGPWILFVAFPWTSHQHIIWVSSGQKFFKALFSFIPIEMVFSSNSFYITDGVNQRASKECIRMSWNWMRNKSICVLESGNRFEVSDRISSLSKCLLKRQIFWYRGSSVYWSPQKSVITDQMDLFPLFISIENGKMCVTWIFCCGGAHCFILDDDG